MTIKPIIKAIAALAVSGMMLSASANSVGFEFMEYDGTAGTVTINLNYDFTDFAMFGGGVDIIYDANAIEFVSYTHRALENADAQDPASPEGSLTAAGTYTGVGIGTFEFFNGMTSAGAIGTFQFNVLGATDAGATPCGMTLCIVENGINPWVSLAGGIVGPELIGNGNSAAAVVVPVPAAVWFMLSGLGALLGFGRKSA